MADRIALSISLTPELERFVEARVASGRYRSVSEVVREGLRLLEESELGSQTTVQDLRREIAVGLEQAERGELYDGEEVFRELEERGGRG